MSILQRLLYWMGLRPDPGPRKYEVAAPLHLSLTTLAKHEGVLKMIFSLTSWPLVLPNTPPKTEFGRNGKHKIRGVASRRGDTRAFVANMQRQVIQILAKEKDPAKLSNLLPEILEVVQERLSDLKKREVPLNELVVTQTLSRELNGDSVQSPLSTAARQLQIQGKTLHSGQQVRYIYTSPGSGVHAWDLPTSLDPQRIDVPQYKELILRAVHELLQPLGVTEAILKNWLISQADYLAPPGFLKTTDPTRLAPPLLADVKYLRMDN